MFSLAQLNKSFLIKYFLYFLQTFSSDNLHLVVDFFLGILLMLADLIQLVLVLFLLGNLLVAQSMQNASQLLFFLLATLEQIAQGLILSVLLLSCKVVNVRQLSMQLSQQSIPLPIIDILALKSLLILVQHLLFQEIIALGLLLIRLSLLLLGFVVHLRVEVLFVLLRFLDHRRQSHRYFSHHLAAFDLLLCVDTLSCLLLGLIL